MYVSAKTIKNKYDVSSASLRSWANTRKVQAIRTSATGKRLYKLTDITAQLGDQGAETKPEPEKKVVCYARVSSQHQKADLGRQIADLQAACPDCEVISDIASGLNFQRKGFTALLERCHRGDISQVVVTYKDRLCRYGLELVEFILQKAGTKLVVLGQSMSAERPDAARELADDLLAVVTVFVARHNGQRSADNKRKRAAAAAVQKPSHPSVAVQRAEAEVEPVDQSSAVYVQCNGGKLKRQKV